jgi:ubiquinone/menaquinone biosynthesis C-methylase UbiE
MEPARTAREQFDRQAKEYDAVWNQWSEEPLRWLITHAKPQPCDSALDVATGTGFTALALAPYVRSVVGLDVSTGMLAEAARNAERNTATNVTWREGEAEAMPFDDGTFDLVTCRIAPHHFRSVPAFLRETRRVLRQGGRFVLVDTSVPSDSEAAEWQNRVERLRDPSHVCNYSASAWRAMVEEAGLTVDTLDAASGGIPITLKDWLRKAGCTGDVAESVTGLFLNAPAGAIAEFNINRLQDGDVAFVWQRVALRARRL